MTDLSTLNVSAACDAGAELTIMHPTKAEATEIRIKIAGPDSRKARDATRAMTDQLTKDAIEKKLTPDDATFERMAAMHAAAITLGWEGVQWNGEPYPFSNETAIKLYTEHRWIRTQVEEFAGQRANFFKA